MARFGSNRCNRWELLLRLTLPLVLIAASAARAQEIDENLFKAAFLFNVAEFVEWPHGTFKGSGDPVVGCILGESPLAGLLERGASSNLVGERKFVVRRISNVQGSDGCHILFVSSAEQKHWRSILDWAKNKGLLTVGETEGFAAQGGVVNFRREGDRIRIQINPQAAEDEKLKISSRLLSLSETVKEVR